MSEQVKTHAIVREIDCNVGVSIAPPDLLAVGKGTVTDPVTGMPLPSKTIFDAVASQRSMLPSI